MTPRSGRRTDDRSSAESRCHAPARSEFMYLMGREVMPWSDGSLGAGGGSRDSRPSWRVVAPSRGAPGRAAAMGVYCLPL
ncbi:hypothetical protein [Ornithinimicrobium kibberense]|uniref:hypothetical protein n=1 Tax=Ornithinimicrobium kibberense TaxID=282060 RepID=UPI003615BF5B